MDLESVTTRVAELRVGDAAAEDAKAVLAALASSPEGLSGGERGEAAERLTAVGPNAVRTHHVRVLAVLGRQLRSALLILLAVTAGVSYFFGERTGAVIIAGVLVLSVALGFVNEYRAEKAAQALHSRVRHTAVVVRDGAATEVDVTELVPGDVVRLTLGQVVPADLRLLACTAFACDESVLTGESAPADKAPEPVAAGAALAELTSCALMGTVVHGGSATGVVVATGGRAEFGRIALGLGERQPETEFQAGLRRFSMLLLKVAAALTTGISAPTREPRIRRYATAPSGTASNAGPAASATPDRCDLVRHCHQSHRRYSTETIRVTSGGRERSAAQRRPSRPVSSAPSRVCPCPRVLSASRIHRSLHRTGRPRWLTPTPDRCIRAGQRSAKCHRPARTRTREPRIQSVGPGRSECERRGCLGQSCGTTATGAAAWCITAW
ncbi:HAD-IC family P-type ATPase, partial [Streptomyces lunaelactis]|uniref:HAD-IC family P-type ATPase n=1 Tax=Streptomyces lunaelactis TaxID=1535768 RepID=UPI0020C80C40